MKCLVFVGSLNREAPYFQGARGVGLSAYAFDETTFACVEQAETGTIDNPTFLTVNPAGTHLYACSEVFGWHEGMVGAYRYDHREKSFHYVNAQLTLGSIAAHNCLSRDGSKLMVANYGMGSGGPDQSIVVYGVRDDGGLSQPLSSVAHVGTGPNAERQERSHAHSINEIIDGGIAIVADLGIDRLVSYRVADDGAL
ncbi:MAG: lactonase family protein, partial [Hyphomicrobiales bacterium]|nr:lactonase family protein [Hyphomicrobiales bacterium]